MLGGLHCGFEISRPARSESSWTPSPTLWLNTIRAGTYVCFPATAGASDSQSMVLSQGGRIRRLWIDGGRVETIPFQTPVQRTISEAARGHARIGDSFRVRAVRWPVSSPDGKQLVFEAVGQLWLMRLPDGEPRPLTTWEPDAFQLTPDWSPGRRLNRVRDVAGRSGRAFVESQFRGRKTGASHGSSGFLFEPELGWRRSVDRGQSLAGGFNASLVRSTVGVDSDHSRGWFHHSTDRSRPAAAEFPGKGKPALSCAGWKAQVGRRPGPRAQNACLDRSSRAGSCPFAGRSLAGGRVSGRCLPGEPAGRYLCRWAVRN